MKSISLIVTGLTGAYATQAFGGGSNCAAQGCYGMNCNAFMAVAWGGDNVQSTTCGALGQAEYYGCDCSGCECDTGLGFDADAQSDDYNPAVNDIGYGNTATCDQYVFFGFTCAHLESNNGLDCTGSICEEAQFDYVKGDGSCPTTCFGASCDDFGADNLEQFGNSCYALEGAEKQCDCSGCDCDFISEEDLDSFQHKYKSLDCNGNWHSPGSLGDETCDDEIVTYTRFVQTAGAEQTWFVCNNCPELECDGGDCEEGCARGEGCALTLEDLCADEDSALSPMPEGYAVWCSGDDAESDDAATVPATTATVVAGDDDSSMKLGVAAIALIALVM